MTDTPIVKLVSAIKKYPGQTAETYALKSGYTPQMFVAACRLGLVEWQSDDYGEIRYWPTEQ